MAFRYRPEVLDALARHGLAPRAGTSPQLLRDAINDLYRYEIRRLRQRLLRKEFPKEAYVPKVVELRGKYLLLSMPIDEWMLNRRPGGQEIMDHLQEIKRSGGLERSV